MNTRIRTFAQVDPYGKNTVPGMRGLASDRRMRRVAHGRKHFFHRNKNGVHDPITFFHITDAILSIEPNETFRSSDLVAFLTETSHSSSGTPKP